MTHVAVTILDDLTALLRDQRKLSLLSPVFESAITLSDMADPLGGNFDTYSEADRLAQGLYKYVGFILKYKR